MAYSLQDFRAARSYELVKRRQAVALYRTFLRYEELRRDYEENSKSQVDEGGEAEGEDLMAIARKKSEVAAQNKRLRKSMEQISLRLSQMLQIPDYKVRPQFSSLPKIDYSGRYNKLDSANGYGRLALQILATDIEGARLRHQRVRLEKWPRVNFGLSAPQVYSSNSDTEFDINSVRLFGDLTRGFDILKNNQKERVELSKQDFELVKSNAHYRMIGEREMLRQAKSQFADLLAKKRSLYAALEINKDLLRSGIEGERLMDAVEQRQQLSNQLKSINRSIKSQELEFWIWDETAWK